MTQKQEVLRYMKERGSITSIQGATELFIVDTRKRIAELRDDGFEIEDEDIHRKNRYGRAITYKRWRLARVPAYENSAAEDLLDQINHNW